MFYNFCFMNWCFYTENAFKLIFFVLMIMKTVHGCFMKGMNVHKTNLCSWHKWLDWELYSKMTEMTRLRDCKSSPFRKKELGILQYFPSKSCGCHQLKWLNGLLRYTPDRKPFSWLNAYLLNLCLFWKAWTVSSYNWDGFFSKIYYELCSLLRIPISLFMSLTTHSMWEC